MYDMVDAALIIKHTTFSPPACILLSLPMAAFPLLSNFERLDLFGSVM
jgi:hypothetical protein